MKVTLPMPHHLGIAQPTGVEGSETRDSTHMFLKLKLHMPAGKMDCSCGAYIGDKLAGLQSRVRPVEAVIKIGCPSDRQIPLGADMPGLASAIASDQLPSYAVNAVSKALAPVEESGDTQRQSAPKLDSGGLVQIDYVARSDYADLERPEVAIALASVTA